MSDFFEMVKDISREKSMVRLIERTSFKDDTRKAEITEKKFSDINSCYKALSQAGITGEAIYNLKKHGKAIIDYDDAQTVIELQMPKIEIAK